MTRHPHRSAHQGQHGSTGRADRPEPAQQPDGPATTAATGTFAGQMVAEGSGPSAEWYKCDGSTFQPRALWGRGTLGGLNPTDYFRRVGRWSGALNFPGWRMRLPLNTAYFVSLADNPNATALPANTPTAQHPPAGTR